MEEEKKLSIKECREDVEKIFKKASHFKLDIRSNKFGDKELIEKSKDFAKTVDDFLWVITEIYSDDYEAYDDWFEFNFDKEKLYRKVMFFREEEIGEFSEEVNRIKKYFNHCMMYLLMANHFIMYLEFNELYDECMISKEEEKSEK